MDAVVIAFASGKGGTGKSTTSALLGASLAREKKKVLLIELSSGLRNLDVITGTGADTVYDLNDVLTGRCAPYKAIVKSPLYPQLFVISAPTSGGEINLYTMQQLCARMKSYFDYILLDVESGVGPALSAACSVCQRMVLVLTPDPLVIRDAHFVTDATPADVQTRLIINKVPSDGLPPDGDLESLDDIIDQTGVQLLGVVPESKLIFTAATSGKVLPQDSFESKVYATIARRIDGADLPLLVR